MADDATAGVAAALHELASGPLPPEEAALTAACSAMQALFMTKKGKNNYPKLQKLLTVGLGVLELSARAELLLLMVPKLCAVEPLALLALASIHPGRRGDGFPLLPLSVRVRRLGEALLHEGLARRIPPKVTLRLSQVLHLHPPFDLADALARDMHEQQKWSLLLPMITVWQLPHLSGLKLLMQLAEANEWTHIDTLLDGVADEDEQRELAIAAITHALSTQHYKASNRLIHRFGLKSSFPDAGRLQKVDRLHKLMAKGRYDSAKAFAGDMPDLRLLVVQLLHARGEAELATQVAEEYGMQDELEAAKAASMMHGGDAAGSSVADGAGGSSFLESPLGEEHIHFIGDSDSIAMATRMLETVAPACDGGPAVVGLDAEWKAAMSRGAKRHKVSILQLSTATDAFVLDMLNCAAELDALLTRLFTRTDVIKLGFAFSGDMRELRRSFPDCGFHRELNRLLDLKDVSRLLAPEASHRSLAALAQHCLGRPLNKLQRMSDWELRPLSAAQMRYAALDATVLVMILQVALAAHFEYDALLLDMKAGADSGRKTKRKKKKNKKDRQAASLAVDSTLPQLGVEQVKEALRRAGLSDAWFEQDKSMATAEAAAEVLGVELGAIAKSLAFNVDGQPVCVLCSGDARVRSRKLAQYFDVARRKVRIVTAEECLSQFGYPPGSLPPAGHRSRILTVIDSALQRFDTLYLGGGSEESFMRLTVSQLVALTGGSLLPLWDVDTSAPAERAAFIAAPLRAPAGDGTLRFAVDDMLSKLARWLRMLGLDAESIKRPDRLAQLRAYEASDRIILTRDRKLLTECPSAAIFLFTVDELQLQISEVLEHFGLCPAEDDLMSRCSACNSVGYDILTRAETEATFPGVVSAKVLPKVDTFYVCKGCTKVYWRGPKYETARSSLLQIVAEAAKSRGPAGSEGEGEAKAVEVDVDVVDVSLEDGSVGVAVAAAEEVAESIVAAAIAGSDGSGSGSEHASG